MGRDGAQGATADIGIILARGCLDPEHLYVARTPVAELERVPFWARKRRTSSAIAVRQAEGDLDRALTWLGSEDATVTRLAAIVDADTTQHGIDENGARQRRYNTWAAWGTTDMHDPNPHSGKDDPLPATRATGVGAGAVHPRPRPTPSQSRTRLRTRLRNQPITARQHLTRDDGNGSAHWRHATR